MKGLLNIDKPAGWTSGDVVFKARKILNTKTVGHMGTLDPQGTGVLVLGIGKAARLFSYYLKKDKQIYTLLQTHIYTNNTHNLAF